MMNEISDVAINSYYANIFERAHGYDPYEGPYEDEDREEEEDG